jgi:hypothetical protein
MRKLKFLLRRQVLEIYRDLLRVALKIEDEYYKREITEWIKRDFKNGKNLDDEVLL